MADLHFQDSDPIVLGSGELYAVKFSDVADPSALTTTEEAKLINIGAIKEDATINVAREYVEMTSSNRGLVGKLLSKTNVKFTAGVITFVLENLSKFITGGTYTSNETTGEKKLIINSTTAPNLYLRFIHTDKETGDQLIVNFYKVVMDGEQEFAFGTENPTETNYEFSALAVQIGGKESYCEFIQKPAAV